MCGHQNFMQLISKLAHIFQIKNAEPGKIPKVANRGHDPPSQELFKAKMRS